MLYFYYTFSYNNNKFKISAPTWNGGCQLSDGSYLISDIQDYFEHILKKHNENNPSIKIYVNKTENRIKFKSKKGQYFDILAPETMKLLGSTESKTTKNKRSE